MGAKHLEDDIDLKHYSLEEVSSLSGFSLRSLARYVADGSLKSKKIKRRRVISRRAFLEFMEIVPSENLSSKRNNKR